jgi:nicotinamidase-related amidase
MRAVLIIVDMLNDFFEQSPVLANERARLVAHTNLLVRGFRSAGLPVFWIRQEFAADLHDAFPEMRAKKASITIAGTKGCELLFELDCLPVDSVIVKKRYSAFFGTDLDAQLLKIRPDFVVVAGVNTHACVRMTAVDAYQRDYEVIVAADCVASNDPEHHDVTLRYLDGKIGRVLPAAEILRLIKAPPKPALQRT